MVSDGQRDFRDAQHHDALVLAAFGGDLPALKAAQGEIRKHFAENSHVTDSKVIATLCAEGLEAAHFLAGSVVQGRLNTRGNFGVQLCMHAPLLSRVSLKQDLY
jgi:hypothetical protein